MTTRNKVYLACSAECRLLIAGLARLLRRGGIEIVSHWHSTKIVSDNSERAYIDYTGISGCDVLVACYPYGYGTCSEMGFALGSGKKVIYFAPDEYFEDAPLPAGHAGVIHCSNYVDLFTALGVKHTDDVLMDLADYEELYRLRAEVQGPDGFATWKDAAIHERQRRIALEKQLGIQNEKDKTS